MRLGRIVIDIAPVRSSRDFRWLFSGRLIGNIGNTVVLTAANWQVYALTHSSLAVGLVSLADSVGMLIGLMGGGVLADRHDRRSVLLAALPPQALLAGLLLGNSLLPRPALWPVYLLMFGLGLFAGLSSPASTSAVPLLVGPAQLAAAVALNATGSQLGNLVGPAFAGYLIAGPGVAACYGLDVLCFAAFAVTAAFVRPLPPADGSERLGLRSIADGFRFVRHSGVVGGMLLVDANAMIFGMPSALFPALATEHFHGGSATFGLLTAAPAFGALVGAATSGWTGHVRRPGLVVIGAGMVWGAAIVGFGLTSNLAVGLAFLALAGFGDLISEILRNALLQFYTPNRLRGRVSSLYLAQVQGAPSLGNVEAGAVAQAFSPVISVVSGGLACVAGAALLGALIPALRRARLGAPGPSVPEESATPA
jgi:ENTS family enterobactin (siderophore) exporter